MRARFAGLRQALRAGLERRRTCPGPDRARTIGVEVVIVLGESEQRSWDEIEQGWTEDTRSGTGLVVLAIGAAGIALMFAMVGAPRAALAVLVVPALGWSLARYWRDIGTACEAAFIPMDGWGAEPDEAHRAR